MLALLLLLLPLHSASAQDSLPETSHCKITFASLGRELWGTEKRCWTKPFHLSKSELPTFIPALEVTGIVLLMDHDLSDKMQQLIRHDKTTLKWAENITHLGEGSIQAGISGVMLGSGLLFHDQKLKETGLLSAEALIHASLFVTVFKYALGRERPAAGNHNGDFKWLDAAIHSTNHNSCPSGHTTSTWAMATVIASQYKETIWVPVLCYTTATAVGLSSVALQKHGPGDVVAGAFLGKYFYPIRRCSPYE